MVRENESRIFISCQFIINLNQKRLSRNTCSDLLWYIEYSILDYDLASKLNNLSINDVQYDGKLKKMTQR